MLRAPRLFSILLLGATFASAQELWPDLSSPPKAVGGGEKDAAVIVGAERYTFVAPVPGATDNARDWYAYFTKSLGLPAERVALLRDNEATLEKMRKFATRAAAQVREGGTVWFIFIGHGAPAKDGSDGLLVGTDAQQDADSLYARSLSQRELLAVLEKGKQGRTAVLIDACFSGRTVEGTPLVDGLQPLVVQTAATALGPRTVMFTAAKSNQFAGPLPGVGRPAFSYLALGALRGWAVAGKTATVTAKEIAAYAGMALGAMAKDRTQEPEVLGDSGARFTAGRETGPDIEALVLRTAPAKTSPLEFRVSALPAVPKANMPSLSAGGGLPRARLPGAMENAGGIDFGSVDVESLGKYDEAVKFDKSDASPEAKGARWRALGAEVKDYAALAAKRAAEWDDYAAQAAFNAVLENDKAEVDPEGKALSWTELGSKYPEFAQTARQRAQEWERYAKELAAAEAAREQRAELRDRDWAKLSKLLSFSVVSNEDKKKFARAFVQAYGNTSTDNPYGAELSPYLPPGTMKDIAGDRAVSPRKGKVGIEWVLIPGGSFTRGLGNGDEGPPHTVTIKSFRMAKTEVTNKQYKACVTAGACTPGNTYGASFGEDDQPVVGVDWDQAMAFSKWVGGRLPTEAEWEYAARSAGKRWKYPWGDEAATCERAVIDYGGDGCGRHETWHVCSKPGGNTQQGLCDMAGNVWEWVHDWYHNSYTGAPTDGSAWETPAGSSRVDRGGSWNFDADFARSAIRDSTEPDGRSNFLGFRPAR